MEIIIVTDCLSILNMFVVRHTTTLELIMFAQQFFITTAIERDNVIRI